MKKKIANFSKNWPPVVTRDEWKVWDFLKIKTKCRESFSIGALSVHRRDASFFKKKKIFFCVEQLACVA